MPFSKQSAICKKKKGGKFQVIFEEKINHNQSFSDFSKTEAINLKKLASFPSWPSAAQDTYVYS